MWPLRLHISRAWVFQKRNHRRGVRARRYEAVCAGTTGHTEAVHITFNSDVTFEELVPNSSKRPLSSSSRLASPSLSLASRSPRVCVPSQLTVLWDRMDPTHVRPRQIGKSVSEKRTRQFCVCLGQIHLSTAPEDPSFRIVSRASASERKASREARRHVDRQGNDVGTQRRSGVWLGRAREQPSSSSPFESFDLGSRWLCENLNVSLSRRSRKGAV